MKYSTAVAIIPEGLSPVLTLTMTIGVMRMAKQHAIVRKLDAIETLGNVTDICSDKTGTISEGVMAVKECILSNDMVFRILGYDTEMTETSKSLQAVQTFSTNNNMASTASAAVPTTSTPSKWPSAPLVLVNAGLSQSVSQEQEFMDTLSQLQPKIVTTDYVNHENDLLKTFLMVSSMCNGCSLSKGNVEVPSSKRKKPGNIFKRIKEYKKKLGKIFPHEVKPLKSGEKEVEDEEEELYVGDPTEIALMTLAQQYGLGKKNLETIDVPKEKTSMEEELKEKDSTHMFTLFQEYPFDSNLKRMSVIYTKNGENEREHADIIQSHTDAMEDSPHATMEYIFVKGAPEHVLKYSTHYYLSEKHVGVDQVPSTDTSKDDQSTKQIMAPISQKYLDHLRQQNDALAKKGLRVLALAFRQREHLPHLLSNSILSTTTSGNTYEEEKKENPKVHELQVPLLKDTKSENLYHTDPSLINYYERSQVERELIFVGLVGIQDPPRQGVRESISVCHQAGITVRMITGDHKATAVAIAKQVGLVTPEMLASTSPSNPIAMNAHDFDALTDEELKNLKELPIIISRCTPESKERMIHALHQRNRGTVMCGDGINDCPSIKAADVGIAMGKSGSDVIKDCADIVLTDDNFSTIVVAVKEGRNMFENIRKFVSHLLAGNVAQTILLVISLLSGLRPPLNSIQILWLNMITGTGKLSSW